MARIPKLCSGAEFEATGQYWTGGSTGITRETTIVRSGGGVASWKALSASANGVLFPSALAEFWFAKGVYLAAAGNTFIKWRDAGNVVHLSLLHNAGSGTVALYRGDASSGGTLIATGSIVVSVATWFHVQGRIKIDDSVGVAQIYINSVLDINFAGDTRNGGIASVSNWNTQNSANAMYFDDIIYDDAALPGDSHLVYIYPDGAGDSTQWTPSAGANWQCVDERPCSDTDYVSAGSGGLIDNYTLSDYVGSDLEIIGAWGVMCGTSTVGGEQAKVGFKTGGINYVSAAQNLGTGASQLFPGDYHATNPATSVAWVEADMDGLQATIESV